MKLQNDSRGFSVIEALLILVLVGIVGGTGWYVLHTRQQTHKAYLDANKSSMRQPDAAKTTQTHLDIKEWGVKVPVSATIKDAYYVVSTNSNDDGKANTMWLGLKSLDSDGCLAAQANTGGDYPIGAITKSLPDATDPVTGEMLTQMHPDGVTIDGYYYAYVSGVSSPAGCVTKNDIKDAGTIDAAFKAAGRAIVKE